MKVPKDPRSTGRRRGRAVLEKTGRRYQCECEGECGLSHKNPCGYTPSKQSRSDTLDVDHKNKNVLDNDPVNLWWLCRACHKNIDKTTAKGVSRIEDEYGYGDIYNLS